MAWLSQSRSLSAKDAVLSLSESHFDRLSAHVPRDTRLPP